MWQKIKDIIGTSLAWLILSSKNPQAVSLSVKAGLVLLLTWLTTIAGLGHIQLPTEDLTNLIDTIVQITQLGLTLISAIYTAIGIVRKVWRTLQGLHVGINSLF